MVSQVVPNNNQQIANPVDRVEQMLKDRRVKVASFSHLRAKVHTIDLFDISHKFARLYHYVKSTVPALRPLARIVPGTGERIDPFRTHFMTGQQVSNLCQLLESFSWMLDEKVQGVG